MNIQKNTYICSMAEPQKITRYAYAKKHKVDFQLIYARTSGKFPSIPMDENNLIDANYPFKRRLKCGRKSTKKA